MSPVKFSPRRLGHVNLYVENLERSLRFYEEVCGIERVRMEAQINAGFVSNGNTHHDVGLIEVSRGNDRYGRDGKVQIRSTRGTQPGLNHLGWEMESEAALVDAYKRFTASGASPTALYDHIISHAVYVTDPDGNVHEFYADTIPDWRSVFNLEHDDLVTSQWDPLAQPASPQKNYVDDAAISLKRDALLQTRHLTGAAFLTRNFEAMCRFLREVAGLQLVAQTSGARRTAVFGGTCGRADLVLAEAGSDDASTGFHLLSLLLDEGVDLAASATALANRGVAVERRVVDARREALVVRDPDGVPVELYRSRGREWLEPLTLR